MLLKTNISFPDGGLLFFRDLVLRGSLGTALAHFDCVFTPMLLRFSSLGLQLSSSRGKTSQDRTNLKNKLIVNQPGNFNPVSGTPEGITILVSWMPKALQLGHMQSPIWHFMATKVIGSSPGTLPHFEIPRVYDFCSK